MLRPKYFVGNIKPDLVRPDIVKKKRIKEYFEVETGLFSGFCWNDALMLLNISPRNEGFAEINCVPAILRLRYSI